MDNDAIMRDFGAYSTPNERAAYRAGLSTAAAICDAVAKEAETSNTSRGRLTNMGRELQNCAKVCGNRIWAAREMLFVRPSNKG